MQRKDYDRAIEAFTAYIKLAPKDIAGMKDLVVAYRRKGDFERAAANADQATRMNPENAESWNYACWQRAEMGLGLDIALGQCDQGLKLDPAAADLLDSRAFVHFRRQEWALAIADDDAALKIRPKQASSLYVRGLAEGRMGQTGPGDADIAAAKAIEPKVADSYVEVGVSP